MRNQPKTVIVTGASQGIGSGLVKAFLERDYSVVANSRKIKNPVHSRRQKSWRWSTEI
jgi:NAD(P)-dependent dehydrogenase (short-subunit alcohol dehydrogenase family)